MNGLGNEKNNMKSSADFVFIVGSERSGTTILGEILNLHPDISQWYEPYFVWDKYFRNKSHDERTEEDATPEIIKQIYKDFEIFRKKNKCPVIVDKSPRNSLKIPFIQKIFPNARFIHLLRDGRDVTLSINKEWIRRKKIISGTNGGQKFNYEKAFEVIRQWLNRQPFLYDKMRALWFETHGHLFDKTKHLNRLRWHGNIGWGPRFKGWENFFYSRTCLEFNAMQWTNCHTAIKNSWQNIPSDKKLEIRYENLISEPQRTLSKIFDLLKIELKPDFFSQIPQLKSNNYNKWKTEFSETEIDQIRPILSPLLDKFGYTRQIPW